MMSLNVLLGHLRTAPVLGFPLVVAGLGLMLYGWRLWKVCVVLVYAVIGGAVSAWYFGPGEDQWRYALGGAVLLGAISYWPVNVALSVLGGLVGGGGILYLLHESGLTGVTLWAISGVTFVMFYAYGFLNRQRIVIFFTAFLGALLLILGMAAWVMTLPGLYGTFESMARYSLIVVPFILLVPTVMSYFYQIAEMRRMNMSV